MIYTYVHKIKHTLDRAQYAHDLGGRCAVPINGHIGCNLHGTSMGTIHLSRNL